MWSWHFFGIAIRTQGVTCPALVGKPLCHAGGGGRQGRDGRGPYPSIQQQQTPVTPTHLCTQVVGLVAGEHRVAADRAAEPACQQALQAAGCLDLWRMEHSRQAASRNGNGRWHRPMLPERHGAACVLGHVLRASTRPAPAACCAVTPAQQQYKLENARSTARSSCCVGAHHQGHGGAVDIKPGQL